MNLSGIMNKPQKCKCGMNPATQEREFKYIETGFMGKTIETKAICKKCDEEFFLIDPVVA